MEVVMHLVVAAGSSCLDSIKVVTVMVMVCI